MSFSQNVPYTPLLFAISHGYKVYVHDVSGPEQRLITGGLSNYPFLYMDTCVLVKRNIHFTDMICCIVSLFYPKRGINYSWTLKYLRCTLYAWSFKENVIDMQIHLVLDVHLSACIGRRKSSHPCMCYVLVQS